MPKYFKETALKEYGCVDMVNLEFVVNTELADSSRITITIRDSRTTPRHTHIISIYSEAEKKAVVEGLRFLADNLEKSKCE